jgi:hypothetical protein
MHSSVVSSTDRAEPMAKMTGAYFPQSRQAELVSASIVRQARRIPAGVGFAAYLRYAAAMPLFDCEFRVCGEMDPETSSG